jgi:hypothetical protein
MELPMNDERDLSQDQNTHDDETTDTPAVMLADEPDAEVLRPDIVTLISKIAESEPGRAADLLQSLIGFTGVPDRVVTPAGSRAYRWSHHSTPLLDAALALAQGQIRNAQNNRTNEHLNSRYADLAAVFDACRVACSEAGLAVTQPLWPKKGFVMITTRLSHAGQWVEADFPVKAEAQKGVNNKQQVGIAITYGKRYALTSMLGIAAGEDTDGEEEIGNGNGGREDTGARWREAVAGFDRIGIKPPQMLAMVGRTSVGELTHSDLNRLRTKYNELSAERG